MATTIKTFRVADASDVSYATAERISDPSQSGPWEYSITSVQNDFTDRTFDLSEIPNNANIIAAQITYDKSSEGSTRASQSNTIIANGQSLTDAHILSYLQSLSSFGNFGVRFGLYFSVGTHFYTGTTAATVQLQSYVSYKNIALSVTYTVPDDSTVSFGVNNAWQKCNVFYGVNGSWQKCKAFFGDGGEWKGVK